MRTEQEKKEWKERMRGLCKRVGVMTPEERQTMAARMPIITCEGHALTVYNQCFLACQAGGRELTIVGGFRQWKKTGRCVKKGEHAAGVIYVPMYSRDNRDGEGVEGERAEVDGADMSFILVPMFDISQTEEIGAQVGQAVG